MDKQRSVRERKMFTFPWAWAFIISQQLKLSWLILFTVRDELILKMSGWVYSNSWVALSQMHLFCCFIFSPSKQTKETQQSFLCEPERGLLQSIYNMVCVCAFMRTHVYAVHPCQRSAFRQVFELLHHLVLLLREHEFCFTLLSK